MKKIVLLVGVMFLGAAHMSAQKSWTLQDCIDYALENNITLKKSQLQKQSASEDLKGAKAALLPTVLLQWFLFVEWSVDRLEWWA